MTNEELQQRMEFIVEQQAQLTIKADRFAAKVDKLADNGAKADASFNRKIEALVELQSNSEARLGRVEESFVLLVQMVKTADERLNTLDRRLDTLGE